MDAEIAALTDRLDRLERSNRVLRTLLFGAAMLAVGCGASTVANYKTVRSHGIEVFSPDENGSVLTLGRDGKGGRLELKDAAGAVKWVLDVDGLHPPG